MSLAIVKSHPNLQAAVAGFAFCDSTVPLAPGISIRQGRIHEILGDSRDIFALTAAARLPDSLVWIKGLGAKDYPYPYGLTPFVDPGRLILVTPVGRQEILWSAEQALGLKGACVVTDLERGPDLKESQRLQLAAEKGHSLGLLMIGGKAQTSASETRWHCSSLPGEQATWLWHCQKNRRGKTARWGVRWTETEDAQNSLYMVAEPAP